MFLLAAAVIAAVLVVNLVRTVWANYAGLLVGLGVLVIGLYLWNRQRQVEQVRIATAATAPDAARFLNDAQRFRSREQSSASSAPFAVAWPSFAAMGSGQRQWYFYWRSQLRRGQPLPTDISYIYVYAFELINLVEQADAVEAARRLGSLWSHYRAAHPELDSYLPEWGGDLLASRRDVPTALLWWERAADLRVDLSPVIVNALVEQHARSGRAADMPLGLWARLTEYRPRNKFYAEHNSLGEIDRAYLMAVSAADDYYRRASGQGLLERLAAPGVMRLRKTAFEGALVGYSHAPTIDLGHAHDYLNSPDLGHHLTAIVKFAENVMRRQKGFARKLSGAALEPDLAAAVEAALAAGEPIRITLDPARVAALQEESAQVAALLEVMDSPPPAAPSRPLYTELAEMRQLWAALSPADRAAVTAVYRRQPGTFDAEAADRINREALPRLGDRLVFVDGGQVELAEDFLDELDVVVREPPPEPAPARPAGDDPWSSIVARLTPAELALARLFAASGQGTESEMEAATRPHRTMANAALDGLNEKAADILGHPPIYLDGQTWRVEAEDWPAMRASAGVGG